MTGVRLDSVERAVADIAAGRSVVVVDDEDRENEGDLVFAASKATPALLGFMIRWTSGFVCVAVEGATLDRLHIPLMTPHNRERMRTAYTVSVDARDGITTGISAADRAHTIRVLADSATEPHDLVQPGHVMPLRYREGGVLARPGHTEASVDLARLAGLRPAAVLCEMVNDDGTMKRLPDLSAFAEEHGLTLISIADLIAYRRANERQVEQMADTRLPTEFGVFRAVGYRSRTDGSEHVAMVYGDLGGGEDVLVRVHSECLTGDVFGSLRCDCGPQLREAVERVAVSGGFLLYLRQEGRGIGLYAKLEAYALQDAGLDTYEANVALGHDEDERDYTVAAQMLHTLGVGQVTLLSNNPDKREQLCRLGITVTRWVPTGVHLSPSNAGYLATKARRAAHTISLPTVRHS